MRRVGIKGLKDRLSEYLKLASGGERIEVTDRGHVVAEIHPPARRLRGKQSSAELLADLVRQGIATPARRKSAPRSRLRPVMTFDELMRELREDRDAR